MGALASSLCLGVLLPGASPTVFRFALWLSGGFVGNPENYFENWPLIVSSLQFAVAGFFGWRLCQNLAERKFVFRQL
jgi:hypothetical protein